MNKDLGTLLKEALLANGFLKPKKRVLKKGKGAK